MRWKSCVCIAKKHAFSGAEDPGMSGAGKHTADAAIYHI